MTEPATRRRLQPAGRQTRLRGQRLLRRAVQLQETRKGVGLPCRLLQRSRRADRRVRRQPAGELPARRDPGPGLRSSAVQVARRAANCRSRRGYDSASPAQPRPPHPRQLPLLLHLDSGSAVAGHRDLGVQPVPGAEWSHPVLRQHLRTVSCRRPRTSPPPGSPPSTARCSSGWPSRGAQPGRGLVYRGVHGAGLRRRSPSTTARCSAVPPRSGAPRPAVRAPPTRRRPAGCTGHRASAVTGTSVKLGGGRGRYSDGLPLAATRSTRTAARGEHPGQDRPVPAWSSAGCNGRYWRTPASP